jgi:hypothetical protein
MYIIYMTLKYEDLSAMAHFLSMLFQSAEVWLAKVWCTGNEHVWYPVFMKTFTEHMPEFHMPKQKLFAAPN